MLKQIISQPSGILQGSLHLPGDKSISHRALLLGSLQSRDVILEGWLRSSDCLATLAALQVMGVKFTELAAGQLHIHGVGLYGLQAPKQALNMGNSGTAMRLLAGILVGQNFDSILEGDASLCKRPMRRIIEPLTLMGAKISSHDSEHAPLYIQGGQKLQGIHYDLPVASAQVKSAILLAGLYAQGKTSVGEAVVCRDHTEILLAHYNFSGGKSPEFQPPSVPLKRALPSREAKHAAAQQQNNFFSKGIKGGYRISIPADLSSAAFFIVGATIAKGSDIVLSNIGINETRIGILKILQKMGANIEYFDKHIVHGEPRASLRVRSADLHGIDIPKSWISLAIDEFPIICIAAACAKGKTSFCGAEELRVKESDRIQAIADGLSKLGVVVDVYPDGLVIEGCPKLRGGNVDSCGDHRIGMAFAMASLVADEPIIVHDTGNIATSFPNFIDVSKQAGLAIEEKEYVGV